MVRKYTTNYLWCGTFSGNDSEMNKMNRTVARRDSSGIKVSVVMFYFYLVVFFGGGVVLRQEEISYRRD